MSTSDFLDTRPAGGARPHSGQLATWSLLQFLLFTGTLVVLGSAIGWPGILREPPAIVLPTIHAHATATTLGYWLYLMASVALIGLALSLGRWLRDGSVDVVPIDLVTILGVITGVLKTLGIVRWLSVMPVLATTYTAADTAPAMLPVIELIYASLNSYAGAVGELLGTQLFSGLWLLGVGALLLGRRWWVTGGLAVAVGLLSLAISLRIFFGGVAALNAVVGPLGLVWYLLLAVAAWRDRRAVVV